MPILYDLVIFTLTRRKYPSYKRELYAIVVFTTKYNYLIKYPYYPTTIYIDYKPLTYFFVSN